MIASKINLYKKDEKSNSVADDNVSVRSNKSSKRYLKAFNIFNYSKK
jgi:hypothetical protein